MHNTLRSRRQFVPSLEILENLLLLSAADILTFNPAVKSVDGKGRIGWAVPGMYVPVMVNLPDQYMGFKDVTYSIDQAVYTDDASTHYDANVGRVQSGAVTKTYQWLDSNGQPVVGPRQDTWFTLANKDPKNYTISVHADVWMFNGNSKIVVALDDSITLKVEAPFVNYFAVRGSTENRFVVNNGVGNQSVGFTTIAANGFAGFFFNAEVTNNTHYQIRFGFIQTADFQMMSPP